MSKVSDLRAALKKSRPALTVQKDNKTTKQQNDKTTKQQNNMPPARQMTVWIDGDLYEAMLLAKAHGAGSLKQQINRALREKLFSV